MESSKALELGVLAQPFLGNVVEICIVTRDHRKTMDGLLKLGIGPFQVHNFSSGNVTDQTFRFQPADFELIVCFATQGAVVWEIMQPLSGPSLMAEFLETRGEGIHHVAFDCNHVPATQRKAEFEGRGYSMVQSGLWHGKKGTCRFMFFDTEDATTTCFESYSFSEDWEDPESTVWYPANR